MKGTFTKVAGLGLLGLLWVPLGCNGATGASGARAHPGGTEPSEAESSKGDTQGAMKDEKGTPGGGGADAGRTGPAGSSAEGIGRTDGTVSPAESGRGSEVGTFGAGCFWCVEAVLEQQVGVLDVTSGYMGGTIPKPTYRQVCTGTTGHAEVVQVTFDPETISYEELLELFWRLHDPTTLNRQGADVGTQYRSAIFYHSEAQKEAAERSKREKDASGAFRSPIVTEIVEAGPFYKAEDHHQDYYRQNRAAPYCQMVISPKLEKLGLDR